VCPLLNFLASYRGVAWEKGGMLGLGGSPTDASDLLLGCWHHGTTSAQNEKAGMMPAASGIRMIPPLSPARFLFVFHLRSSRQQDPQRVDAERCAERNVEQRQECEHQSQDAGPGFALQQTPSSKKPGGGL